MRNDIGATSVGDIIGTKSDNPISGGLIDKWNIIGFVIVTVIIIVISLFMLHQFTDLSTEEKQQLEEAYDNYFGTPSLFNLVLVVGSIGTILFFIIRLSRCD